MKNKAFRKGQVVICRSIAVLVTGKGGKKAGYPTFAGVVIMEKKSEDEVSWPVGMYSDTWSKDVFSKTDIKISKLIEPLI